MAISGGYLMFDVELSWLMFDEAGEAKHVSREEYNADWVSRIGLEHRQVQRDSFYEVYGEEDLVMSVEVSTVLLPFMHGEHAFESLVFGGLLDGYCTRSRTRGEALKAHAELCLNVKGLS